MGAARAGVRACLAPAVPTATPLRCMGCAWSAAGGTAAAAAAAAFAVAAGVAPRLHGLGLAGLLRAATGCLHRWWRCCNCSQPRGCWAHQRGGTHLHEWVIGVHGQARACSCVRSECAGNACKRDRAGAGGVLTQG